MQIHTIPTNILNPILQHNHQDLHYPPTHIPIPMHPLPRRPIQQWLWQCACDYAFVDSVHSLSPIVIEIRGAGQVFACSAERGFVKRLFVKGGETGNGLEDAELVDTAEVGTDGGREGVVVHFYA